MQHKYKVGQMVDVRPDIGRSNRLAGLSEILTCMPHDRGPLLYRVRSVAEAYDRVVAEGDLALSDAAAPGNDKAEALFTIAISRR
jgi:hypothetical protein